MKMNLKKKVSVVLIGAFMGFVSSCGDQNKPQSNPEPDQENDANEEQQASSKASKKISSKWLSSHDFDGDQNDDKVYFTYTGLSKDCCFKMSLKLSSNGGEMGFPFELEGGYHNLVPDKSHPELFNIDDYDGDGLAEISMEILPHMRDTLVIPDAWKEQFGIHSHHVLIDFEQGELKVSDFKPKEVS